MDGMPKIDPDTGKVWCWSMQKQCYEWRNFSEVIEDHMNFDEGVEADIESTTDEERRAFEAGYELPYRFLDDHDHLFRMYALGNFLHDIGFRSGLNPQIWGLHKLLVHEFMIGELKDASLEDCIRVLKRMVEERPDIAEMLDREEV